VKLDTPLNLVHATIIFLNLTPLLARDYHLDVVLLLYMFHKHITIFMLLNLLSIIIITLMFYHSLYNSCPIVHLQMVY